jgi:hypothetical protein
MSEESLAYLVFLRRGSVLLVKRPESDWRQLQDEYGDYMASLGPWPEADICEHFALEFGEDDSRWPFRRSAIGKYMRAAGPVVLDSDAS